MIDISEITFSALDRPEILMSLFQTLSYPTLLTHPETWPCMLFLSP